MRITLAVVGRLRSEPEKTLVDDYLNRFDKSGRQLGLGPSQVIEIPGKNTTSSQEADQLIRVLPDGAHLIALDERGKDMKSPAFARHIALQRDQGLRDCVFMIGGADGLDPSVRHRADVIMSFGKMVWPHMLARVMLAEQLYRAAQILAGTPYHRD